MYMVFQKDRFKEIKLSCPEMKFQEISKQISTEYKQMSEETKQLYREKTDLFNQEKLVQFNMDNGISEGPE